ncbi:NAD(P)/FAD-dependent oxidoreductase [Intestinibacter bartlettii]|uniref:NAD(P)/FAD-dependent oxidoreductase n=1 Tax=Intestinibacter bartlettii TaxID=261299 RepID=UPI0039A114F7
MNNIYDLIIIGSGPGGLSAGIYSGRAKLKTLIIEKKTFGGQILNTGVIANYPGALEEDTGASLANRMLEQCKKFGAELVKDEVLDLDLQNDIKTIKCKNSIYKTKAIVIATGSKHKKLNIDREDEFLGKGLSYCAICDGHLFEDLDVYVAGGGESAVKESLYLSKFAKKVTILSKYDKLKCSEYIKEKCTNTKNIKVINNAKVTQLLGEDILNGIKITDLKINKEIIFEAGEDGIIGLFVFVGLTPQTDLFKGLLNLDEKGYIKTNEKMETNIKGVYAVGDCRVKDLRQVITASNDGAIAAINVEKYIG